MMTYLLPAARQVRMRAEALADGSVDAVDGGAAEANTLLEEIKVADRLLAAARARIRGGVFNDHRSLLDILVDDSALRTERLDRLSDPLGVRSIEHRHLRVVTEAAPPPTEQEWQAFIEAHPFAERDTPFPSRERWEAKDVARDAWRQERAAWRRELDAVRAQSQPLVDAIDFSPARVLAALDDACREARAAVHVGDVTRRLVAASPIVPDYKKNAYRRAVARTVVALRSLKRDGLVQQQDPPADTYGRETCLWSLATGKQMP